MIKMNKSNYDFIKRVSDGVSRYSQFPKNICDWIGCQFALESSYGDSSLVFTNRNYCGMKNPLVRISTALRAGNPNYGWAEYIDLDSCIIDYLFCLQYHRPMKYDYETIEHFSRFICKFFCPQVDYGNKIHSIYLQFKSFKV